MICNKCKEPAVLNTVLGKDFYYCRTCKEEVQLESPVKLDTRGEHSWSVNEDLCSVCQMTGAEWIASKLPCVGFSSRDRGIRDKYWDAGILFPSITSYGFCSTHGWGDPSKCCAAILKGIP